MTHFDLETKNTNLYWNQLILINYLLTNSIFASAPASCLLDALHNGGNRTSNTQMRNGVNLSAVLHMCLTVGGSIALWRCEGTVLKQSVLKQNTWSPTVPRAPSRHHSAPAVWEAQTQRTISPVSYKWTAEMNYVNVHQRPWRTRVLSTYPSRLSLWALQVSCPVSLPSHLQPSQ